jgi:hypothetical protein
MLVEIVIVEPCNSGLEDVGRLSPTRRRAALSVAGFGMASATHSETRATAEDEHCQCRGPKHGAGGHAAHAAMNSDYCKDCAVCRDKHGVWK